MAEGRERQIAAVLLLLVVLLVWLAWQSFYFPQESRGGLWVSGAAEPHKPPPPAELPGIAIFPQRP